MKRRRLTYVLLANLALVISASGISYGQDARLTKEEKRAARKAEREANYMIMDSLLSSRCFVLEADFLQNFFGEKVNVLSNINFVRLQGMTGVLQTGSNYRFGSNGVGGVTAEGQIGYWNLSKNPKNHTYNLRFNLLTALGPYDISMFVTSDNNANATITGTTAGTLTWIGHLQPLNNSRVFKGSQVVY